MAPASPRPPPAPCGDLVTRGPGQVFSPARGHAAGPLVESLRSLDSPGLPSWTHIPAPPPSHVFDSPPRTPASRRSSDIFNDGDPARGPAGRSLFRSPTAPASPRPTRRVFDSSLSDSDSSDELLDPDSPRFFDSPLRLYSRRLQSEYWIWPPMKRARYSSVSRSPTSLEAALTSCTSTAQTGGRPFSPPRLAARPAARRQAPPVPAPAPVGDDPEAPFVLHRSSQGPAPGQTGGHGAPSFSPSRLVVLPAHPGARRGAPSVPAPASGGDEQEAPFVLHRSQGPAPGQSNEDFIFSRTFDLHEEYENLAITCRRFKRLCQTPSANQTQTTLAWNIISDRLEICQAVRKEIEAAGGSVGEIPYDLLYEEDS